MGAARDYKAMVAHRVVNSPAFADACRCADEEREGESCEQAARRMRMPAGLIQHLREQKLRAAKAQCGAT
jgi:hypothetical protein